MAAGIITKCFGILYIIGTIFALNFWLMKPEDKKQKTEKEEQKSLSVTLLGAYGTIFAAAGIFGGSDLLAIIKKLYQTERPFVLLGVILFSFSFFCLIVSLVITQKDMKGNTELLKNKELVKHKTVLNRISAILFMSAAATFLLLIIVNY